MSWKPTSMWKAGKVKEAQAYEQGLKDALQLVNRCRNDEEITSARLEIRNLIRENYEHIRD